MLSTIRLVVLRAAAAAVGHEAVTTVILRAAFDSLRRIHRQPRVIDAQAIAMRVTVTEQAPLEHPIWRRTDAGNEVRRIEGRLLDLRKEVVGHPIQHELGDRDER